MRKWASIVALLAAPLAAQDSYMSALPQDSSIDGTEWVWCEDAAFTVDSRCELSDLIAAASGTCVADADDDTKVCTEESADDDTVRIDAGGTELMTATAGTGATAVNWFGDDSGGAPLVFNTYASRADGTALSGNDVPFRLNLYGKNSTPANAQFARINVLSLDTTAGSEDGNIQFGVVTAGTLTNEAAILGGEFLAINRSCVGSALGAEVCLSLSGDRLFHDTDADGTKDAGEKFIDENTTSVTDDVAPYGQYDPDNPPASCAVCDEFTDDTASLTWTWGNQDSSTVAVEYDGVLIVGDTATNALHVRATDSPSAGNTDMTITVRYDFTANVASADGCVVGVIESGTIATPTQWSGLMAYETGATDTYAFYEASDYDFAGSSVVGSTGSTNISGLLIAVPNFSQLRYTDSSRAMTAWKSNDGIHWIQAGSSRTLSADPAYWFIGATDGGSCFYHWARARTDADRNNAGE